MSNSAVTIKDFVKIKIMDDSNKYSTTQHHCPKIGELSLGDADSWVCLDGSALDRLSESILALYPNDSIKLVVSYSISNI